MSGLQSENKCMALIPTSEYGDLGSEMRDMSSMHHASENSSVAIMPKYTVPSGLVALVPVEQKMEVHIADKLSFDSMFSRRDSMRSQLAFNSAISRSSLGSYLMPDRIERPLTEADVFEDKKPARRLPRHKGRIGSNIMSGRKDIIAFDFRPVKPEPKTDDE